MGSDQVEGIVGPNVVSPAIAAASHPSRQWNGVWTDAPLCDYCPMHHGADVTFQSVVCDCHCVTCWAHGEEDHRAHTVTPPVRQPQAPLGEESVSLVSGCPHHQRQLHPETLFRSSVPSFVAHESHETLLHEPCDSGPSPRYGHSLCEFYPGHFLLFGGSDGPSHFSDLWVLNSVANGKASWTEIRSLVDGPTPRFGHSCHLHHSRDKLIFFGGGDNQTWFGDMHILPLMEHGLSRRFERHASGSPAVGRGAQCPPPRRSHTLVPWTEGRCVLFGGHSKSSLQDVWLLEHDLSWTEIFPHGTHPTFVYENTPEERYCHSAVIFMDVMYVFGGFTATGPAAPVVWALDLVRQVWSVIETVGTVRPSPRFGHTATLIGSRMLIFGGMDNFPHGTMLNDSFQLHLETFEWKELQSSPRDPTGSSIIAEESVMASVGGAPRHVPSSRRSHAAALDQRKNAVILFGGWSDSHPTAVADGTCFSMVVAKPTLKEMARNWVAATEYRGR